MQSNYCHYQSKKRIRAYDLLKFQLMKARKQRKTSPVAKNPFPLVSLMSFPLRLIKPTILEFKSPRNTETIMAALENMSPMENNEKLC